MARPSPPPCISSRQCPAALAFCTPSSFLPHYRYGRGSLARSSGGMQVDRLRMTAWWPLIFLALMQFPEHTKGQSKCISLSPCLLPCVVLGSWEWSFIFLAFLLFFYFFLYHGVFWQIQLIRVSTKQCLYSINVYKLFLLYRSYLNCLNPRLLIRLKKEHRVGWGGGKEWEIPQDDLSV